MAGINQDVNVLGRTFHVQTELLTKGRPLIHTVIFHSGRAVTSQDREVDAQMLAEKGERELVREQHQAMVASLTERARRHLARREAESEAAPAPPPVEAAVPPPDSAPVEEALQIRRLLGELRQRMGIERAEQRLSAGHRIEHAGRCLDWIIEHRRFSTLRVYDQLQLHGFRTRLAGWRASGSQEGRAEALWQELVGFARDLAEINRRRGLAEFDRQLLGWGLSQIEQQGPTAEVRDRLRQLFGLDPELDGLLESPGSEESSRWLAALQGALEALDRR